MTRLPQNSSASSASAPVSVPVATTLLQAVSLWQPQLAVHPLKDAAALPAVVAPAAVYLVLGLSGVAPRIRSARGGVVVAAAVV